MRTELAFKGTQILSNTIDENDKMLNILALGKTIPNSAIKQAASKLGEYQLGGYQLNIIQGEQSDSLLRTNKEISNPVMSGEAQNQKPLNSRNRYDSWRVVWPTIHATSRWQKTCNRSLKHSSRRWRSSACRMSTRGNRLGKAEKIYPRAVVNSRSRIDASNRATLQRWLKSRCKADSLRLIITP